MRSEIFFIILGMTAATYLTRFSAPVLLQYAGFPQWLEKWLKHVPTAILTALIVPSLLLPKGELDVSVHNHYLLAGIVAAIAAYKSRNVVLTISLGIVTMFVLRRLGL